MTTADAVHRKSGALARGWRSFRRWRRGRPFWAGLFTLLSGLVCYLSTQLSFSNFQIKIGTEGFLTYVIPLVLILCALLIWFTPQQRIFYGVIAAAVALYSFIGVNFGGFLLGMLLGIIGGSLAIAWTPAGPVDGSGVPGGGPAQAEAAAAGEPGVASATVDELLTGPLTDVLPPPVNPLTGPAQPGEPLRGQPLRGEPLREEPPSRGPGNGSGPLPRRTPRLSVITLVPLLLTALAVAGVPGGTPARAEPAPPYPSPCPTGTKPASARPEEPATSSASRSPASQDPAGPSQRPAGAGPAKAEPAGGTGSPGMTPSPAASPPAPSPPAPSPSSSPSPPAPSPLASSTEEPGLIGGLIDGIGDLLGIGDDETPSPSASASPTPTNSRAASGGTGAGHMPEPAAIPGSATPAAPSSAAPQPTSAADCVVVDPKAHSASGVPAVQKVPDRMRGSELTLEHFAFDGVTELNRADGDTIRVLQFSMSKAVTDDFELQVPGPGDHTTSLTSSALTVQQATNEDGTPADGSRRVKFYCSEFTGTLVIDVLGVPIEVPMRLTFTPDLPPPLTFDTMVFADIDIQLVFVDTDVLTAPNLDTKIPV